MWNHRTLLILCTGLPVFTFSPLANALDEIEFNGDVRPILAANCFECHGFDVKTRKADRRLDTAEGASAEHDGLIAVKPGDLAGSELWSRITSTDSEVLMPPPDSKKTLTDAEKDTLRRWIEQGGRYQKHWSFEPPVKNELPKVGQANPIDAFIAQRLQKEGFTNVHNLYGGIFEWVNQGHAVYDLNNKPVNKVHGYSRLWGRFVDRGEKVY